MKALSFYLLVTAMALMETVSAQTFKGPQFVLFYNTGKGKVLIYDKCFSVENVVNILYRVPATCQYYTDMTCKTPTPDYPVPHAAGDKAPPKYSKGFVKCSPPPK
ncbi:hypothetical protein [Absidia glauca]|uniref:Uncharacterized protein n=1 Tax=Absidia glauca TaxID=4829 RepID=A0A168T7U8_ABSGL|nr:hypothetical protein [Absidia glauca]